MEKYTKNFICGFRNGDLVNAKQESSTLDADMVKALTKLKLNSVALVRERTIPTERPPPVGEVSANFCG